MMRTDADAPVAQSLSRRQFLAVSMAVSAGVLRAADTQPADPIIDIHQHTHYMDRTDEQLVRHQQAMGVATTLLLPAGSPVRMPSTHDGKTNGLAAECEGVDSCIRLAVDHPGEYRFYANQVPDLPGARETLTGYLKAGGIGIGEQKFAVRCDSPPIEMVAEVAQQFDVPVLMHFQHETFNFHFENFHNILAKFPKVNFIGHAQTMWSYVDAKCDPAVMYPKGKITPGGITDRYLSDFRNFWVDTSAGSGLNFFNRDEDFARGFLDRHQNRLLFGSDCPDHIGRGPTCLGWMIIRAIRRLSSSKSVERKLLYENAKGLFRL